MNFISDYKYIIIPFLVWFSIQLFKVICDVIKTKKFELKRIMGAGGMPSSHSAVVTVLATLIGKNEGFNTAIFGFSVIFACVVMYDAMGVRREAGNHAKIINKIIDEPTMSNVKTSEKFDEVLGHTPVQVLIGAIIGILIGIVV